EGVSRPSLVTPPAGPQSVSDLQLLLRSRLRVVALILLGLQACSLWLYLGDLIRAGSTGSIVFNVGLFGAFVAYVALLWKTRPLALRELRTLEGVLFGLLMLGYAGYACSATRLGALAQYAGLGKSAIATLAAATALPGVIFLMMYGLFIPNTA